MKIHDGFVSNSSSYSYVIIVGKPKTCDKCGRQDIDIIEDIKYKEDKISENCTEIVATGINEIEESQILEDDEIDEIKSKIKRRYLYAPTHIEKSEQVYLVEINKWDTGLLQELHCGGNVKILYSREDC